MRTKKRRKRKILVLFITILLIALCVFLGLKVFGKGNDVVKKIKKKVVPTLQIVDENSKSRPYAIMINNLDQARPYQSGLQDAYIIYEIIAEGGITRYLAIFKDQNTDRIGSVRSSRHYYLDYALENDAIYVHWGWSPEAQRQISEYGINNINGLAYEGDYFYRDTEIDVDYEHTGCTKMSLLKEATDALGYRKETDQKLLLNYSIKAVDLSKREDAIKAQDITIVYSDYITTSYIYDADAKVYKRSVNGAEQKDYITGLQYTFKNIITYQVENWSIDSYGRQDLANIGSGEGYYISNGYAVPITWEKASKEAQTVYKYKDGTEIKVNDGNTFIQIQPVGETLDITAPQEVVEE